MGASNHSSTYHCGIILSQGKRLSQLPDGSGTESIPHMRTIDDNLGCTISWCHLFDAKGDNPFEMVSIQRDHPRAGYFQGKRQGLPPALTTVIIPSGTSI